MTKYKVFSVFADKKPLQLGEFDSYDTALGFVKRLWPLAAENMRLVAPGFWVYKFRRGATIRICSDDADLD